MDDSHGTDTDLALNRKRGVELMIVGSKPREFVATEGRDSPTKRVCLRQVENAIKPDTPVIPSVKSRLVVLDRQLSAAKDDKMPQQNLNIAAHLMTKSAALEMEVSQKVSATSLSSGFATENWDEVEVINLRRVKKPVDPALQPVSERMASWQKKVDANATSAEQPKCSPLAERRKTACEGKVCGSEDKNTVRSRLSMWEQKLSEEQERATTPIVMPRSFQMEREVGIIEEGKAEVDLVSRDVLAAPRKLSSAIPSLVTPPMPAVRTSIYGLIKKPSPASSLVLSAPMPSARSPARAGAIMSQSGCKDGETVEKMEMKPLSVVPETSEMSTASEDNGGVENLVEANVADKRDASNAGEEQRIEAEMVTEGNDKPDAGLFEAQETSTSEEVVDYPASTTCDVVLPCHETVSAGRSTNATPSPEPHSFSSQLTTAFDRCSATPNPSSDASATESSSSPLPFDLSLLRRPRDASETPSARLIKQVAPRPVSYSSLLEDTEEEENSLRNKRATYAVDVVSKNGERYERSQSVDDALNRFKMAVPIDLGTVVHQNDPIDGEVTALSDDITARKSTVEQLKVLQEAVVREQNIILQTSNALSKCCHSNSAFAGSVEAVECHRLLLISTKKKETYQREIHALKSGGFSDGSTDEVAVRGKMSVNSISLPFKHEFISKVTVGESNTVHHFILAIRCGKTVQFSPVISTQDTVRGFLEVSGPFHFSDIRQSFELELEVYAMSIARDVGTPKKKKLLTPKKKLLGPKSPGGSRAELSVPPFFRASNFQLMGLTKITMPMVNRNQFVLEKVVQSSPLQGTVNLKMVCLMESNIVERGFLTMFEDVNGFGAWHRRWCLLKDNLISYWKYPDDEKSKAAIGSIDLKFCTTDVVGPIPRDTCARPNTFELVTSRRQKQGDTDTLVSKCVNSITTTQYWLSADTKQDRTVWCEKLNEVVCNLRFWHPDFISGGRPSSSSSQDSQI